jgi:hypothetical protein
LKSKEKKGIVTRWVWGIKRRVEIKRRTHEAVCISQPPPHTKARRRRDEEELGFLFTAARSNRRRAISSSSELLS